MASRFPFWRRHPQSAVDQGQLLAAHDPASAASAAPVWRPFPGAARVVPNQMALVLAGPGAAPANPTGPTGDAVTAILDALRPLLPPQPPAPTLPPTVSVVSLTPRAIGVGNRRGTESRGPFNVVALKGGRLDAVVRFQIWSSQAGDLDSAMAGVQSRLLGAEASLRKAGFLRIVGEQVSLVEAVTAIQSFRVTADYRVLFEFHLEDDEGAESLLARIPINLVGELTESTTVTDQMARWDDQAAGDLELIGGRELPTVRRLFILSSLPDGFNGQAVTIAAKVAGVSRERTFASARAFQDAFVLDPTLVQLGGNAYDVGLMVFPNADFPEALALGTGDSFRVHYAAAAFDRPAVLYLRALT